MKNKEELIEKITIGYVIIISILVIIRVIIDIF